MNQYYTVRQVAELLDKSEETVKRWIRSGKCPNAIKLNDKSGWKIPENDIQNLASNSTIHTTHTPNPQFSTPIQITHQDERELASLAYQAVTMTLPTEKILDLLSPLGIKRVLELLLVMRQSPQKVKNPEGFINKAIKENWNSNSIPVKLPRKKSIEKPVRIEILPDWFDENDYEKKVKEEKKAGVSEEEARKEWEAILSPIRNK